MQFSDPMSPTKPKRKQVGRACSNCRHSKTACDESRPCSRCVARGMGATCVDAPKKKRTKKVNSDKPPPKKQKLVHREIPMRIIPIAPKQVVQHPQTSMLPSTPISSSPYTKSTPSRVPSKDAVPSISIENFCEKKDESEERSLSKMDSSSTPFLSLKRPPSGLFSKLPPINSNMQCELPFRTVAEPTVDLFSDTLHKPAPRNLSVSDESLELSGIRKNPSLEALFADVLRETESLNNNNQSNQ